MHVQPGKVETDGRMDHMPGSWSWLHHAVARDRTSSWLSIGGYTGAVVVAVATCKCLAKNGVAVHMLALPSCPCGTDEVAQEED